ncbi:uncharacterized protein METZ01_LOCUS240220 [marine metagenome]|uniref:Uncharacterized protein n=1 Tax=marine metagenome TaxID=408172 RepID=A0A382HJB1_9ZZZZ
MLEFQDKTPVRRLKEFPKRLSQRQKRAQPFTMIAAIFNC